MKPGVEWLRQYTDEHKLSFNAFLSYLKGIMVPSDMPEEVMKGIIERAEANRIYAEDAKAKRAKERKLAKHSEKHAKTECGQGASTYVVPFQLKVIEPPDPA
jgi:hypothetical protein